MKSQVQVDGRGPRGRRSVSGRLLVGVGSLLLLVAIACFAIHGRNNNYLLRETAFIFDAPGDVESKAKALAHFVAMHSEQAVNPDFASFGAKLERTLPAGLSPATVLQEGFAFPDARRNGPCGQLARTIRAVAWLRHIRSQKVLLGTGANEHAMVALYVDGAYRLFDPTYDFYWTNRSGHVASVEEVRGDPEIFAQVYRRVPGYEYNLSDASYLRWSRLGRPGAWIKSALTATMGAAWVADIGTPKLYDRPWWGYAWVSLLAGLFCTGLGFARMRHREHARAS